jgi:hypothetical protein
VPHSIGLVRYDGFAHAWALDLPGCVAGAPDLDALRGPLDVALAEHVAWLRHHGMDAESDGAWRITEEVDGMALAATGGEWCFDADKQPLDERELRSMLDAAGFTRDDLRAAVDGLPDALLDWDPPVKVVHADPWAPEARTIRGLVRHVLQLEIYYRGSLRDGPAPGIFEAVGDPHSEHRTTRTLFEEMTPEARSRVYRPVHPSRKEPEDWTARKALRRLISHERAHTAEIWQRRAWMVVGVPSQ